MSEQLQALEMHGQGEPAPLVGFALMDWFSYRMACVEWARKTAKARYEALLKQAENEEAFLQQHYGRAFETEVAEAIQKQPGKAKSIKLGCATAGYRSTKGAVEVIDEDALLAEVAKRPELAELRRERLVISISRTAVREWIEKTGEELPGVQIEPPGERFYIRAELKALPMDKDTTDTERQSDE